MLCFFLRAANCLQVFIIIAFLLAQVLACKSIISARKSSVFVVPVECLAGTFFCLQAFSYLPLLPLHSALRVFCLHASPL